MKDSPTKSEKAPGLSQLRVLDLSSGIAGPYCARLLADCGAETIKIEDPAGGDPTRRDGAYIAHDVSALYAYLNQNKRGVSLDIRTPTGQSVLKQLVERSDVVVESFDPGTLDRLGLGYEDLARVNPGIVLVSVTPFGQVGPDCGQKADSLNMIALSGFMSGIGDPAREPLQTGVPSIEYAAGVCGAIGALASVRGRRQDGKGQHVDVSIQAVGVNLISFSHVLEWSGGQKAMKRGVTFPYAMKAKDGYIVVSVLSAQQWRSALELMEMHDLLADEELVYNLSSRMARQKELQARADEWAKDKTRDEIFNAGHQLRVPVSYPYTASEMIECPQLREREFFEKVSQPGLGEFLQPKAAFVAPLLKKERTPAPNLGQHNAPVFAELGIEAEDLAALRTAGVV